MFQLNVSAEMDLPHGSQVERVKHSETNVHSCTAIM